MIRAGPLLQLPQPALAEPKVGVSCRRSGDTGNQQQGIGERRTPGPACLAESTENSSIVGNSSKGQMDWADGSSKTQLAASPECGEQEGRKEGQELLQLPP